MKNNPRLTELVKAEAAKLKRLATKSELKKLSFNYLDPDDVSSCVYGQATGSCFTNRALELIKKCAPKMYKGYGTCDARLNGKYSSEDRGKTSSECYHWSPIEVFISIDENIATKNKALIDYLKGETETLDI